MTFVNLAEPVPMTNGGRGYFNAASKRPFTSNKKKGTGPRILWKAISKRSDRDISCDRHKNSIIIYSYLCI